MPDRPQYARTFTPRPSLDRAPRPGGRSAPRRWTREGFIPFRLDVLTPVFVGSGGDLSPLEYVIREENDGYALHLADTEAWLTTAQDREDIRAALDRGDMLRLRRLMNEQMDTALHSLGRIPVPSAATARELQARINDPKSLSNAEVQPFARNPATMAAFVPGSSLKGAMSTPLIDSLDHGGLRAAVRSPDRRAYSKTMEGLLGTIREHAMQALKVSDVPVPPGGTRIVAAREVRREEGKPGTPKTPCETLPPSAVGGMPLYGRLFMDATGGGPRITLPNGKALTLVELGERCKAFYGKRFRDELEKFYRRPHLDGVGRALQSVLARIEALDPEREILLRVGHYSHVECVTVSDNAPQGRKGVFGRTRTLADRELPFGWLVLSFCDEEEYRQGLARVEEAIAVAAQERETRRQAREADLRRALDERRRLAEAAAQARARAEEEQRRREHEAAEREERLAALSPEERAIAEVAAPDAAEAQSMALFARLDSLEDGLRAKAAAALRDCWQRLGKWEGKLSKKQAAKVAEVKRLLQG